MLPVMNTFSAANANTWSGMSQEGETQPPAEWLWHATGISALVPLYPSSRQKFALASNTMRAEAWLHVKSIALSGDLERGTLYMVPDRGTISQPGVVGVDIFKVSLLRASGTGGDAISSNIPVLSQTLWALNIDSLVPILAEGPCDFV